ncbi:MAG TPA: DUF2905 domain-containing protein, partial [Bacteroidota bacterium]|nr:DUF2905 domain-containing protein [Bacteroidota bacterium]
MGGSLTRAFCRMQTSGMAGVGKLLVVFGVVMVVVGCVLMFFDKIPLLGKLPGDIHIKKEHTEFYFPIVTSL